MTDAQTTFARATLEYDKDHERALMEAITQTIFESSTVSDANAHRDPNRRVPPRPC